MASQSLSPAATVFSKKSASSIAIWFGERAAAIPALHRAHEYECDHSAAPLSPALEHQQRGIFAVTMSLVLLWR